MPPPLPVDTPKVETENVSSAHNQLLTKLLPPKKKKAPRGILKQKNSGQVTSTSLDLTDQDLQLQHRPSRCEHCRLGMELVLKPTHSQSSIREVIARLHAAEMAADVEALHSKPSSLAPSKSSSEKSATMNKGEKSAEGTAVSAQETSSPTAVPKDPLQVHHARHFQPPTAMMPVDDEESQQHRLAKAATTIHMQGIQPNIVQKTDLAAPAAPGSTDRPVVSQASRFREDMHDASRSTPALSNPTQLTPKETMQPFVPSATIHHTSPPTSFLEGEGESSGEDGFE